MADWETAGAGDGVAVPQDSNDGHQDTFDTTALAGALNEADEAAFKDKAQEAGWVGTIPVNYNVQQSNREDELAAYAASSAVYEWDDEYGDVGPEVPQLEEQLFNNAFRLRQGKHMANLQLEVTVEGPNKIHPVRSVSSHSSLTTWNSTDHHTV
jgi:ATP-dependent RNA helicase DDX3X